MASSAESPDGHAIPRLVHQTAPTERSRSLVGWAHPKDSVYRIFVFPTSILVVKHVDLHAKPTKRITGQLSCSLCAHIRGD